MPNTTAVEAILAFARNGISTNFQDSQAMPIETAISVSLVMAPDAPANSNPSVR